MRDHFDEIGTSSCGDAEFIDVQLECLVRQMFISWFFTFSITYEIASWSLPEVGRNKV